MENDIVAYKNKKTYKARILLKIVNKENISNLFFYLTGFVLTGLGSNLMKISNLGNGAWDTVNINASSYFKIKSDVNWITMGMITFIVSFIIMVSVIVYRKKLKFIFMIIPIILASLSLDLWNSLVFHDQILPNFDLKILSFVVGSLVLPLGLVLVIKSSYPAFVFDELMLMLTKIFKINKISYVRFSIETTGLFIGSVFGYLTYFATNHTLGVVNVGSIIFTIFIGPIMAKYFKMFKIDRD